jgi:hypothetical protein
VEDLGERVSLAELSEQIPFRYAFNPSNAELKIEAATIQREILADEVFGLPPAWLCRGEKAIEQSVSKSGAPQRIANAAISENRRSDGRGAGPR